MLYMAAISYMQQAKEANDKQDHATRYSLVEKTTSIVRGLRACLDFGPNEEVALALNNYYEVLEELLISVQCEDDKERGVICDQVIENLRRIKEAWENVNLNVSVVDEDSDAVEGAPLAEKEDYKSKDLSI